MDNKQRKAQAEEDQTLAYETGSKEIERLEGLIKEEAKPKLRHGDCIFGKNSKRWYFYNKSEDFAIGEDGGQCDATLHFKDTPVALNTFDHLKAMSEPLEEFEVPSLIPTLKQKAGAHISADGKGICLDFESGCGTVRFDFDKTTEYIQKLQRLVATLLKRKQKGV